MVETRSACIDSANNLIVLILLMTVTSVDAHYLSVMCSALLPFAQIGKLTEIPSVGHSREDLWSLGILLDKEEEGGEEEENGSSKEGDCR